MSELPYNRQAEEDTIAGFMYFPLWIDDPLFEPHLEPQDFYYWPCRVIFKAIRRLNKIKPYWYEPDLAQFLNRVGVLDKIGGREYLHKLAGRAFHRAQGDRHAHEPQHYAVIVKKMSLLRAQLLEAQRLANEAIKAARPYWEAGI
jgi:replicative DNA helicase